MLFKNETEFNSRMREVFRHCGLQCLHIREADIPGPADLIVWEGQNLVAWIELKIDKEELRTSQKQFLRDRNIEGALALVFRFMNKSRMINVYQSVEDKPFAILPLVTDWFDYLMMWRGHVRNGVPLHLANLIDGVNRK